VGAWAVAVLFGAAAAVVGTLAVVGILAAAFFFAPLGVGVFTTALLIAVFFTDVFFVAAFFARGACTALFAFGTGPDRNPSLPS